jgi:hypothetical protein
MYFPSEIWTEIKDFAGIYSLSTDWKFDHIYAGNWIQFYLEWVQPSAEDIHKLKEVNDIKRVLFTRVFSRRHWQRAHFLNKTHQSLKGNSDKEVHHVFRCCNALLDIKPEELTEEYDMIEFYIKFNLEKEKEEGMIQAIHALLHRCRMGRLYYDYQQGSLILCIHVKP